MKITNNFSFAKPFIRTNLITFGSISTDDFTLADSFEYIENTSDEEQDEDIAKKFEISLKNIKDACEEKKRQVSGFFKEKKKAKIQVVLIKSFVFLLQSASRKGR